MGVKKYTVYTSPRKNMMGSDFAEITRSMSEESLVTSEKKYAGCNAQGRITVGYRGGGMRRKYRITDFKGNSKDSIPVKVVVTEYGPNRTANIALPRYANGAKAYTLVPQGLTISQTVMGGDRVETRAGNYLPPALISVGFEIYNIEFYPGKDAQLTRTVGVIAQLTVKEGKHVALRLLSGETRMMPTNCRTAMGSIGNDEHDLINLGKVGRKHHMGTHPTVRGSVTNPNDHPYGGGEGRASIGHPGLCTPQGRPVMGLKTRKKNKQSGKLIVRRRNGKT